MERYGIIQKIKHLPRNGHVILGLNIIQPPMRANPVRRENTKVARITTVAPISMRDIILRVAEQLRRVVFATAPYTTVVFVYLDTVQPELAQVRHVPHAPQDMPHQAHLPAVMIR